MPNYHWEGYSRPQVRTPAQNWIFMSYETATNVRIRSRRSSKSVGDKFQLGAKYPAINWSELNGVFNRTFSFRRDADATVSHGYSEKMSDDEVSSMPVKPKWSDKFDNYTKHNFNSSVNAGVAPVVWFVSHCRSESGRDRYVRRLAQHIGVHIYGKCGNIKCGQDRRLRNPYQVDTDPCFDLVNKEYKFYLSLENDICNDYITEKAFNALKLDTIPILLTGADIKSTLPPNSAIDGLKFAPEELADYLYLLLQRPEMFLSYFSWRSQYRVTSHQSVPSPCSLCQALHSRQWTVSKTYTDIQSWFNTQSGCRSWDGVYPRQEKRKRRRRREK